TYDPALLRAALRQSGRAMRRWGLSADSIAAPPDGRTTPGSIAALPHTTGVLLADTGVARDEVFVTTKLPPGRAGAERATLAASLDALGLGHVDLWLIHWPPSGGARPDVWERFLELQGEGLARAVGVSNYSLDQIDELERATSRLPAVNQIEWSPALYDEATLRGHRSRGVQLEGYSPLKTMRLRDPRLMRIADAHGATPAQVVIRWHIEHEVVVIPKSTRPERIAINADVFGFSLSEDELEVLDRFRS
ncbi:MAG: 2,5-diketo-D-gluconate reductase, partial [Gaiellales bacterium]|nr:2,5-diketo-D-gluconate reductase [Gaiellales bacterium]